MTKDTKTPAVAKQIDIIMEGSDQLQNYASTLIGLRKTFVDGGFESYEAFELVLEIARQVNKSE